MPRSDHAGSLSRCLIPSILFCGACLSGLSGCEPAHGKDGNPAGHGAVRVGVAPAVGKPVVDKLEFSGRLEAIDRVEVRARVPGYITEVRFQAGTLVRKGDVLFVVDPRPYQAELNQATASLASARAKAELAQVELTRAERLLGDRAIAQREYDERAAASKEAGANVQAAAARVEAARLNLAYTRVLAPISGRVSKEEITFGNLITPSQMLTSVVSTERIYASFDGDEATYLRVAAARRQQRTVPVRVGLAGEAGFPHEGRLQFVDNQLDARAGSVRMRALLENADGTLAPGLFARVQLAADGSASGVPAVLVTDAAIGTDQDRRYVYVVGADHKARYRAVTVGQLEDGLRVVRSGLKAGENVVVSGLQRIHADDTVSPQNVAMPAGPGAVDGPLADNRAPATRVPDDGGKGIR